jgi:gliding motility-associated-like protein
LLLLLSASIQSQTYLMNNTAVSTCSGTFYDSGGQLGNYLASETYVKTFCPSTPGNYIQLNFSMFDVEGEPFDYMTIYEGTGTGGAIIGTYGNISPLDCIDIIASSHASGCITVSFVSDGSLQYNGWAASISCTNIPGGVISPAVTNTVCGGANPFCADSGTLEFPNTTDGGCVPDAPAAITNNTCLIVAPNPAWYYLEIGISGNINLEIEQTTGINGTGTGLDVDYAIWGPFANLAATCADFTLGDCTGDHTCTGNVVDCSYSPAAIENATIPNAQVGEIYMMLITNFDGAAGYITMTQTNGSSLGAGSTDCSIVCPTMVGTNPTSCGGNDGSIQISGLDPSTSYNITYLDNVTPVAVSLTSNAAGQVNIIGLSGGNYTNIVTNFVGCTTATVNILLAGTSAPTVTNLNAATPICTGNDAMFNITGTPNATVTYNINSGGNTTIILSAAGIGIVTVPAVNANTTINLISISIPGCSAPLAMTITVVVNPPATLALTSVSADRSLCINTPMTNILYTIGSGATTATVLALPAGLSGALTSATTFAISGTPTQNGTFNYSVQALGLCGNSVVLTGTIVVNPLPVITGIFSVCVGFTTVLSTTDTPAVVNPWVSSDPSVATVTATGTVTGIASGTAVITFTAANGCTDTETITVNAVALITGTLNVCEGLTTTLSTVSPPVAVNPWVSSNLTVATVSAGGVVTGVSTGTATITFTALNGCTNTKIITVNALPAISGTLNVCVGSTTPLLSTIPAAALNPWISSNPLLAAVNNLGVVTGISAGTVIITFTGLNGCTDAETITINGLPLITGTFNVCEGSTISLSSATAPAAVNPWVSSNPLIATVNTTGVVTGVSLGMATITFTALNGCTDTKAITVNSIPTLIGTFMVCEGNTTALSSTSTPAAINPWVSSDPSIATVNAAGLVTGIAVGIVTITFTGQNGCTHTEIITVNVLPVITGTLNVCQGQTTILSSTSTPATVNAWVSSDATIATVSSSGIVTGVSVGTTIITFTDTNGCTDTETITVSPLSTITGTFEVCVGLTTSLSSASAPAVVNPWVSSNPLIATISATGVFTGVASGTTTISFTSLNGCTDTEIITVNALPIIAGTFNVCEGLTTTLLTSVAPAVVAPWISSNPLIANINSSGVVTGVSTGMTTIIFTGINGCTDTETITVSPLVTITGTLSVCEGLTTALSSVSAPAAVNPWVSSDPLVATVNSSGLVSGIAAGTATIAFTGLSGCANSVLITVIALPIITGTFAVCEGLATTLSTLLAPAILNPWVSSDPLIATINSSGIATGIAVGTTTITFTGLSGCTDTEIITVNPLPIITGTFNVCETLTTALSTMLAPAVLNPWVSSNPLTATISASGLVTGISSGTTTITFTALNGCTDTETITVNALPTITGTLNVCVGLTTTLSSAVTPALVNSWISSNPLIATISASGVVTGIAPGSTTITFTALNGCTSTAIVTVNALPIITGTFTVCVGLNTTLSSLSVPAVVNPWVSSNPLIATVSPNGIVTGVSSGTSTITYTDANACTVSQVVTVVAAAAITGVFTVCVNATTNLSNSSLPIAGNPWSSSNPLIASIDVNGMVTGNTPGTTTITYTSSNNCMITATVTVIAIPVISGTFIVCEGSTTTLSGASTPALINPWMSSDLLVATVSATGVVSAISAGTATLTFTNLDGCTKTQIITVTALPIISGTFAICQGSTATLSGSTSPAISNPWVSSNVLVATVNAAGLVTGISSGTTVITYTNANGCIDTQTITVNANPVITGTFSLCQGLSTTLSGGSVPNPINPWISSNPLIATVSATGVVTAVSFGTTTITFNNVNGCIDTETITVYALPTITGNFTLCLGLTTALSGSGTAAVLNPWSSSNTAIVAINNNGLVTTNAVGSATVSYTNSNGCVATQVITVNPLPVIAGNLFICQGSTTTLSTLDSPADSNPWVSDNPSVASVDIFGVVTGNANGTATITYTNSNTCVTSRIVTVNPLPTISGVLTLCEGYTTTLSGSAFPAAVNAWISSNPSVATVSSIGVVTGILAGTTTITYTNSNGCKISENITVNPTPKVIATPTFSICSEDTTSITLSSLVPGTIFLWTAVANNVTGASNGNGNIIEQPLVAIDNTIGNVVYTIVPTSPLGCVGPPFVITVHVNILPLPTLTDGVICRNPTTGIVGRTYILNAGLNNANFYFEWYLNDTIISGENNNTYEVVEGGVYSVIATNTVTGCMSAPVFAVVTESEIAEVAIINGNEAFVDNAVITVLVIGNGNYEYQLDNSPWQTSNAFSLLTIGLHEIHVRDADDCTAITQEFTVIGYPKFFTPNGDGYNDLWNIWSLSDQTASNIYIYDRYGKFIKQMSPAGEGWNGTLNGRELPATDYWFTVEYLHPDTGLRNEFKSHFSLKR